MRATSDSRNALHDAFGWPRLSPEPPGVGAGPVVVFAGWLADNGRVLGARVELLGRDVELAVAEEFFVARDRLPAALVVGARLGSARRASGGRVFGLAHRAGGCAFWWRLQASRRRRSRSRRWVIAVGCARASVGRAAGPAT